MSNSNGPINLIIVSVSLDDRTPFTGLTAEDFLVATYSIDTGVPNKVAIKSVNELPNELPGIDFQGVYKLEPEFEEVFSQVKVGQTVYAIKISRIAFTPVQVRYFGQTVVSVVMLKPQ